ncbi:MAG: M28 family peptidase, partial [Pseudomonadota bacterium]
MKNSADPLKLKDHVKAIATDIGPRDYGKIKQLNLTADYIKKQFQRMGYSAQEQIYSLNGQDYKNIIVRIGPRISGEEGGELTVVGAHYDTHEFGPGADDNASGVAGLLEL